MVALGVEINWQPRQTRSLHSWACSVRAVLVWVLGEAEAKGSIGQGFYEGKYSQRGK